MMFLSKNVHMGYFYYYNTLFDMLAITVAVAKQPDMVGM